MRNFIPILSRWLCQLGAMTALRASAWRAGRLSVFTVADPQKFLQIRSRIRRNLLAYFFRLYGKQTVIWPSKSPQSLRRLCKWHMDYPFITVVSLPFLSLILRGLIQSALINQP